MVVLSTLAAASAPLDAAAIAGGFRQGKRVEAKVASILAALTGYGTVWTPDGRRFLLRRVA